MSRYLQPNKWNINADYKGYLENEILNDENRKQAERIRGRFQVVDKLGPTQSAELLLKLSSFLNQSVI